MYPLKHVVNSILNLDFADGISTITPMKIQKLLYFLNGWYLALMDEPVIKEQFKAWQYGPVEEHLYHLLKIHRGQILTQYLNELDNGNEVAFMVSPEETNFHSILNSVWDKYGHYSAIDLSAMTHVKDSPWDIVYNQRTDLVDIPNGMIKKYFKGLIND